MQNIKKLAVICSGGDSPGMNAALEGLVSECEHHHIQVLGFWDGFQGIIENRFRVLKRADVWGKARVGGAMLGSARSAAFLTMGGRKQALANLKKNKVDALVVIGGDGSMRGAQDLRKLGFRVVGLPGTIDNDLFGSDDTLGYKTAANVIVESLENIRHTADSCKATYLIYTMGRHSGYLALRGAISGRADTVLIPEKRLTEAHLIQKVNKTFQSVARSHLIVISEAYFDKNEKKLLTLTKLLEKKTLSGKVRVQNVGYLQRGSNPIEHDVFLGLRLGTGIVKPLLEGKDGFMLGLVQNDFCFTPLSDVGHKLLNPSEIMLGERLNLF